MIKYKYNSIEELNLTIDRLVEFSENNKNLIKTIAEEAYQIGYSRAFNRMNEKDFDNSITEKTRREIIKLVNTIYAENRELKQRLNKLSSDTNRTK